MATNANPKRSQSGGNGGKRTEINLRMPEQIAGGVYANGMMVQHTADEFVLDFAMVMTGTGTVVSRVVTSPGHAKRIAEALQENIAKYEAAHGPIRRSGGPPGLQMGSRPPVDEDE